MIITILGFVGGTITNLSGIPQIIKIIKSKETRALSYISLNMNIIGMICTLIYGSIINKPPIYISTSFSIILLSTMLICKYKYENGNYIIIDENIEQINESDIENQYSNI